jgi:HK97 family phage major capsid protein
MTSDRAAAMILEEVAKKGGAPVITPGAERTGEMLELTEREQKQYNLCRGIMTHVANAENPKTRATSFETEISDELAKKHEGKYRGGLVVPFRLNIDPTLVRTAVEILKRTGVSTALTAGTATKGSELVFTEPGPFIQFLYNRMRLKELGAETISGLQGNIAFPKQTGKASGSWVAENPGSDVADSNATLSQVTMSPKTYQSSTAYSRQLLAQAVVDVDNLVRNDLATDVALAIDSAGISGAGGSAPTGILSTSGVQAVTLKNDSGNGSVIVWDDIVDMEALIEDVNADQVGDPAWLTTPSVKAQLKRTPQLVYTPPGGSTAVTVASAPIWEKGDEIDGRMARQSNQVPSTLTKGTSSGDCHAFIYGVFSTLINGMWGSGFELIVDPYRLKKQGLIELTTFVLTDWANRYPVAFAAAKDVTLT